MSRISREDIAFEIFIGHNIFLSGDMYVLIQRSFAAHLLYTDDALQIITFCTCEVITGRYFQKKSQTHIHISVYIIRNHGWAKKKQIFQFLILSNPELCPHYLCMFCSWYHYACRGSILVLSMQKFSFGALPNVESSISGVLYCYYSYREGGNNVQARK